MIQLIKYEWKKAFLKKTIVILMVIFIIIDLIKIVDIYNKKSYLISAGTVWRGGWFVSAATMTTASVSPLTNGIT